MFNVECSKVIMKKENNNGGPIIYKERIRTHTHRCVSAREENLHLKQTLRTNFNKKVAKSASEIAGCSV